MEILRRIVSKINEPLQSNPDGFIERMQQKTDESRSLEYSRELARQSEVRRSENERKLKVRALRKSLVPGYAQQLYSALGNQEPLRISNDGHIRFLVRYGIDLRGFIDIRGNIDGTVIVGKTLLDSKQKKDKKVVEDAFENAYNEPDWELDYDDPNFNSGF
jgi:hypothetical protein